MKTERKQIFRELEPPPGGAARLRARLGTRTGHPGRQAWWLGPALVAVIAALALSPFRFDLTTESAPPPDTLLMAAAFDRLLGRTSAPYELSVARGTERLTVSELESSHPNVRLVQFGSPQPQSAEADNAPL